MQTLRSKLIAVAVLAILAVIGSFMGPRPVAAAGGPTVTIDGPLPLPVVSAPNPVFAPGFCTTVAGTGSCTADFYTVPAGKRLVVEYFSVLAQLPSAGDTAIVTLSNSTSSALHLLPLLPLAAPTVIGGFTSGGQAVRMYFGPSQIVRATGIRSGASFPGTAGFNFSITGYLVNATP